MLVTRRVMLMDMRRPLPLSQGMSIVEFARLTARTAFFLLGALLPHLVLSQVDLARAMSCDGCTEQERAEIVTSLARVPGESQVLIVDAYSRRLHLYEVWVDKEPGLFQVTMEERAAPAEAVAAFEQLLALFPARKELDLAAGVPSFCQGEGSSVGANYLSDGTCRGWINALVRNSYSNTLRATVVGPWTVQVLTAFTRTVQGPRQIRVHVRAPDGSLIEIEAKVMVTIDFETIVTDLVVKSVIANGIELPLNAEALRGQTFSTSHRGIYNDFRRLFGNWSIDLRQVCGSQQRIVCPPDPSPTNPCVSQITCK
ncbi:MAG: hypothetical protein KatS3mg127_1360 [Silanimonas sp.]|nr:MAG: hypothetical protein KatS3mg127_1360 [Silanimonas sp.]